MRDGEIWLLKELQMKNHIVRRHRCEFDQVSAVTQNLRVADHWTASPFPDHRWSSTRGQDAIQLQLNVLWPTTPSKAVGKKWKDWQCHPSPPWEWDEETKQRLQLLMQLGLIRVTYRRGLTVEVFRGWRHQAQPDLHLLELKLQVKDAAANTVLLLPIYSLSCISCSSKPTKAEIHTAHDL